MYHKKTGFECYATGKEAFNMPRNSSRWTVRVQANVGGKAFARAILALQEQGRIVENQSEAIRWIVDEFVGGLGLDEEELDMDEANEIVSFGSAGFWKRRQSGFSGALVKEERSNRNAPSDEDVSLEIQRAALEAGKRIGWRPSEEIEKTIERGKPIIERKENWPIGYTVEDISELQEKNRRELEELKKQRNVQSNDEKV